MAKIKTENGKSYESNSIFDLFRDQSKEIAIDKQNEDAAKNQIMSDNEETIAKTKALLDAITRGNPSKKKDSDASWLARLRKEGSGR